MNLDQFIQDNEPGGKPHKLIVYQAEIERLLSLRYSHDQIRQYLLLKEVICSTKTVSYFIRNYIKSKARSGNAKSTNQIGKIETLELNTSIDKELPNKPDNNQSNNPSQTKSMDAITATFNQQQINLESFS